MNKLLIVGHVDSGIERLESLLYLRGFHPALPSRRDLRRPEAVIGGMRKAQNLPEPWAPRSEEAFRQIRPGQAWQGVAADLLLGNENREPWLWASAGCLPFLDFWMELDPGLLVVMVYDEPFTVLGWEGGPSRGDGSDAIQRMENWEAYNSAMLRFFLRNRERCLLIHGGQAAADPERCCALITRTLDIAPLVAAHGAGSAVGIPEQSQVQSAGRLGRFLVDAAFSEDSRFTQLYEELQAAASLPMEVPAEIPAAMDALADFQAHGDFIRELIGREKSGHAEKELFQRQLVEVQAALEENYLDMQGYKWRLREAERRLAAPHGAVERVKQQLAYRLGSTLVNGSRSIAGILFLPLALLIESCHFVLTKKRLAKRKDKLPALKDYADFEAAEKIKKQLSYRIGRVLLRNLKSPVGWFRLPFAMSAEISDFRKARQAGPARVSNETPS